MWPIECGVFSGSKVSLQSLLMRSPWEPINLNASAILIQCRGAYTHSHTLRNTHYCLIVCGTYLHNAAFAHSEDTVGAHSLNTLRNMQFAAKHTPTSKCLALMLSRSEEVINKFYPNRNSFNRNKRTVYNIHNDTQHIAVSELFYKCVT